MAYASAIITGVAAILSAVGSVASASMTEDAMDEQNAAMKKAGEEAKGIAEQEREDTLKLTRENRKLKKQEMRGTERHRKFQRRQAMSMDQRQRVGELAGIVSNAAATDSVFKNMVRGRR